ncbi:MAG TPA: hypothetical protein VGR81_00170 [Candidatus Acidoferrales bacterium]|nr:hypothetical protein [Candidatus Acidoferrales bacterium]
MKKIGLPIILALLALSVTTIALDPSSGKAAQSSQNRTSQDKKPDPPVGTSRDGNQGAPLQSPPVEEHNQNIYTNETKADWWARISNILMAIGTLALAIIGFIGARIALGTLDKIKEQTAHAETAAEAARDSAKAAFLNAQAVINNERPWIMLSSFDPPGKDYWSLVTQMVASRQPLNAVLNFRNFGNTPAWITRSTAMLEICDEERMKYAFDYGEPPWNRDPRPLPQGREGAPFKIVTFLHAERSLSVEELQLLQNEKAFLLVYGYVWYQDPFFEQTKEIHKTYFSFRYSVFRDSDESLGGRWERYGGSGTNRHT